MMSSVSVVVPARNAQATIEETLRSLIACPEAEQIIVVDDGSTDATRAVAQAVDNRRIQIVTGPGTGISDALNAGFAAVTAPYIARCDADDVFPADRLTWQVAALRDHPEAIAISAGFSSMLEDGTPCGDLACDGAVRDVAGMLKNGQPMTSFCTWLTRTEAIRQVGGARAWFRTAEDLDLQFRLAMLGPVIHIPRVSYVYRLHDRSIVHSEAKTSRQFFDDHAKAFCADRRQTGSDALDRGDALPSPPEPATSQTTTDRPDVLRAVDQGIGHAIGTAWVDSRKGKKRAALKRLLRLLPKAPTSRDLWTSIVRISLSRSGRT